MRKVLQSGTVSIISDQKHSRPPHFPAVSLHPTPTDQQLHITSRLVWVMNDIVELTSENNITVYI